MGEHDVTTVEGDGFRIRVDDQSWHAQVRVDGDQGARGKVLNFVDETAKGLADQLGSLSASLVAVQNKVLGLAQPPAPVEPAPESPA